MTDKKMIVPIFSSPDVVLFPKTPLPLYIFEERYRAMVRDVIAGTGNLVIALSRPPGGESGHEGTSAVYETACLSRIENCEKLENGKYNIVVVGVHRVKIIREVQKFPYPMVEVKPIADPECGEMTESLMERHDNLCKLFTRFTELATGADTHAMELMPQLDFESLINIVAMTLNLEVEQKQALLEMNELYQRCDALLPVLQQQVETLDLVQRFEHIRPENPNFN